MTVRCRPRNSNAHTSHAWEHQLLRTRRRCSSWSRPRFPMNRPRCGTASIVEKGVTRFCKGMDLTTIRAAAPTPKGSPGPSRGPATNPSLSPQRHEGAEAALAQDEAAPDQQAEVDREEDVGEPRTADAHVGGDGAAQIACQQDRAQHGGARD